MAGNDQHRHEDRDVNAWAVGKFAVALVILCAAALVILAGLYKYFQSTEAVTEPPPSAMRAGARRLPPEPRLQDQPVLDLEAMRAAEDQVLNSYGWVDRPGGVVRIPINRAMELLAQRGLPSRPQGEGASASRASIPAESGLGPIMLPPGGPLNEGLKK